MKIIGGIAVMLLFFTSISAQYHETMNPNGLKLNLKDYGLVDDGAAKDQSQIFQKAINKVSLQGGGILIVPKGTYRLAKVNLQSNVHLQIEANTVLKPVWPAGTKTMVFGFSPATSVSNKNEQAYIENVSIRGLGGRFIVDYHDHVETKGEGCRAIVFSMVKNFLVQDMDVKDNYSTYCAMTLSPSNTKTKNVSKWQVSRATDGTIRNCRVFKASPGYGLVQLHGARRIHFEDLYALGGVALRLETGANNQHVGVYAITGKNITCENGRCALMMGPHSAKNGLVTVENVKAISCEYAVTVGMGGVKKGAPDQTPGYFANGSSVKNIHAVFGKMAQVKKNNFLFIPTQYYEDLKIWPDNKFMDGPSIGIVTDNSQTYDVSIKNITAEGFKYNHKKITSLSSKESGNWGSAFKDWLETHNSAKYKSNKSAVVKDFSIEK